MGDLGCCAIIIGGNFFSFYDHGHVVLSYNDLYSVKVTLDGLTSGYYNTTQGEDTSLLVKLPHFYKDKWEI